MLDVLKQSCQTVALNVLRRFLRFYFRIGWVEHNHEVEQLSGGVFIANSRAWIDALIVAAILQEELHSQKQGFAVAINKRHKRHWWAELLQLLMPVYFYDPVKPDSASNQKIIAEIRKGRSFLMQPEGRPSQTGSLLPACDGIAHILAITKPVLHPIYVEGTEFSRFAAANPRKAPKRWFPKVTLHLFAPTFLKLPEDLKGRALMDASSDQLYDILSTCRYEQYNRQRTLFEAVTEAASLFGQRHKIMEDEQRGSMTYRHLIAGAYVLAFALRSVLQKGHNTVGLMLPNVNGAPLTFLALHILGKTPAMLNYTAGRANLLAASRATGFNCVITARRFIQLADAGALVEAFEKQGIRVIYLEDVRERIKPLDKVCGFLRAMGGASSFLRLHQRNKKILSPESPAVVLFTSGSEGAPKGVVLSHRNLLANIGQILSRIHFGTSDCMFNALPLFHSSGLTGGVILPLLSGMKLFLYPTPLHYQTIPELIADTEATTLFATDTFLAGYARYAHPHDLHRLHYVFAGAEKLRDSTRKIWLEKFGVRILEGYGTSETAPVLSMNTPAHYKSASVGRFVPGIDYELEAVAGMENAGRLLVRGENIMMGYLMQSDPEILQPPHAGWYDTGDIVSVDEEGFIHIVGRAKRFAKIGGEMVSLTAVEQHIGALWPEAAHAALRREHASKGEQILLVTTQKEASREAILEHFRAAGIPELYVPRQIFYLDELPVLGTGKTNYGEVELWLDKTRAGAE